MLATGCCLVLEWSKDLPNAQFDLPIENFLAHWGCSHKYTTFLTQLASPSTETVPLWCVWVFSGPPHFRHGFLGLHLEACRKLILCFSMSCLLWSTWTVQCTVRVYPDVVHGPIQHIIWSIPLGSQDRALYCPNGSSQGFGRTYRCVYSQGQQYRSDVAFLV